MQRCPERNCCRAGDDVGNCGHFAMPCPTPVEINPALDVTIRCDACDSTRSADARDLMSGKVRITGCQRDTGSCKAFLVPAETLAPAPARSKGSASKGA